MGHCALADAASEAVFGKPRTATARTAVVQEALEELQPEHSEDDHHEGGEGGDVGHVGERVEQSVHLQQGSRAAG